MSKDTRVFKVVYAGRKPDKYCTRTSVSGMFGTSMYRVSTGRSDILKVEATSASATEGWTDVTDEFRRPVLPSLVCSYHKHYTGVRKPNRGNPSWYGNRCTCWSIYCEVHPGYPAHWSYCTSASNDPAKCDCQVSKKLFGDGNDPETG